MAIPGLAAPVAKGLVKGIDKTASVVKDANNILQNAENVAKTALRNDEKLGNEMVYINCICLYIE